MVNSFKKATPSKMVDSDLFFDGQNLSNTIIDERDFSYKVNKVYLSSTRPINVIIKVANFEQHVDYVISANTRGKIIQLLADDVTKLSRVYQLQAGAHIDFATPDFNRTNRDVHVRVELLDLDARAEWFLSALVDKQHSKIYDISFLHKHGHTYANMKNFGVIIDNSKLFFSGTSSILENMSRSETHQTAKIIIFDQGAVAKADPILVIHNNDVVASHAATVGKVNAEHLYYMQSRGISELDTKKLITKGFLEPVIKFIDDQAIADKLHVTLEEAL